MCIGFYIKNNPSAIVSVSIEQALSGTFFGWELPTIGK